MTIFLSGASISRDPSLTSSLGSRRNCHLIDLSLRQNLLLR